MMKAKMVLAALGVASLASLASLGRVTAADAQVIDLSGEFTCVRNCLAGPDGGPPALAYVTQNGWDLNLVNEAGVPSRAWVDWPGHIWAERWQEGAIYSPDGLTIQFDRGTVWQRYVALPPPPPVRYRRHRVR